MEAETSHNSITRVWDAALSGNKILYLSGPISTGPRLVKHLRAGKSSERELAEVRKRNSEDMIAAAKKLRRSRNEIVIEPASLEVGEWTQSDYHRLWQYLIEHHAKTVVFMTGWEYSVGCAIEFGQAIRNNVPTRTLMGNPLSIDEGLAMLRAAEQDLRENDANGLLTPFAKKIEAVSANLATGLKAFVLSSSLRKDESLEHLAKRGMNVAQFVSFQPERGRPKFAYLRMCEWNGSTQTSTRTLVGELLNRSAEGSVNVRSYHPHDSKSREFVYGINDIDEAVTTVERLSAEGLHTIVNETIDVRDGGVSGVLMGDVIEFSPDDTPRCVEKPGTVSFPRGIGREVLATVYGTPIDLSVPFASRLEFSVHPRPRGWKRTNVIVWEFAEERVFRLKPDVSWPNNFSRMIGDKVFGLLVADQYGLPVPRTTVINRRIAPFSFGQETDWNETWIRTAPSEQMPGLLTTHRGWIDPFKLVSEDDPEGSAISSVISQAGIYPAFSGALIVSADGHVIIEGREGAGDSLMLGKVEPEHLPTKIIDEIRELYSEAEGSLGPVRFEWVHDRKKAWLVQFHRGATATTDMWLTPGDATSWIEFDVKSGLPALRDLLSKIPANTGLALNGRIGLTSHLADLIRKSRIPARMKH